MYTTPCLRIRGTLLSALCCGALLGGVCRSYAQQPIRPVVSVTPLEEAVLVAWDSLAEKSPPHPFDGYRLYRARLHDGPYGLIREWRVSSIVPAVRSFLDVGDDNADGSVSGTEGLHNELTYYYTVSAFADSVVQPFRPASETFSDTLLAIPRTVPTNYSSNPIALIGRTGYAGILPDPRIVVTNRGNFRALLEGHTIRVNVSTASTGTEYVLPIVVSDDQSGSVSTYVIIPGCQIQGDSANAGARSGTFEAQNALTFNAFDVQVPWRFTQSPLPLHLDTVAANAPSGANTPIFFRDTVAGAIPGMFGNNNTFGESTYEIEFLPGGVDTTNAATKRIFNYLNVKVTELTGARELQPDTVSEIRAAPRWNHWTVSRFAFNLKSNPNIGSFTVSTNRYYLATNVDTTAVWEFSNVIGIENVRIVFDYANKGRGAGRPWPLAGYKATVDFAPGDKIRVNVTGGALGPFPYQANFLYSVGAASKVMPTSAALDDIRVVPNPYLIRNEAQISPRDPRLRFDYLPEECEIRIYTVALDLVKVIHHEGGAVEYWDLTNQAGNRVGSQLLLARIESPGGASTIKKFSVVLGE